MGYEGDEIYGMPAGRELDAAVAVTFFDWRWMEYPAPSGAGLMLAGLFPPDASGRICVANGYDEIWQPSDRGKKRFSNWDTCPWWDGSKLYAGFPRYSSDMTDAWLVMAHLRDLWTAATAGVAGRDGDFSLPFDDGAFFERLQRQADRRWPWAALYMEPDAICRAALLAWQR